MKQHKIPDPAPITENMTDLAVGTGSHDLVGRTVITAYEIPDSERGETLLLLDNGRVLMLSCDPRYADDDVTRVADEWECCMFDSTDTAAGQAVKTLALGHWL